MTKLLTRSRSYDSLRSVPLLILKGSMTGPAGSVEVIISWVWWIGHFFEITIAAGGFSNPLQFASFT